jgi:hypothetical protein
VEDSLLKPAHFIGAAVALAACLAAFFMLSTPPKFKETERRLAVRRGMDFIIQFARQPKIFVENGADLLWCFYAIASTAADPDLSQMAWAAGRERAAEYRRLHSAVPADATVGDIIDLVHGNYSADMIAGNVAPIKEQLRRAATRFSPYEYMWYDATREPPPSDVPNECSRGHQNERGVNVCRRCGEKLTMQSRYDVWLDSVIASYTGDKYGIVLGARYADVIRWAAVMHPYRPRFGNPEFIQMVYAATHVVYTSNDYSKYLLSPRCLPDEFNFLKATLTEAIALEDPETMGEFLDSLRAFGLTESDPLIRTGMDYTLRTQNPDGSWGDPKGDDYSRYHSTWTAVDGLREYLWTETRCPLITTASIPPAPITPAPIGRSPHF